MDWQPIDTCPKTEREPFLIYAPVMRAATDAWNVHKTWWDTEQGRLMDFAGNATHWRPMPATPTMN